MKRLVLLTLVLCSVMIPSFVFADEWCDEFGHNWVEWTIMEKPTVFKRGYRMRHCDECELLQGEWLKKRKAFLKVTKRITLRAGKSRRIKIKYDKTDKIKKIISTRKSVARVNKKGKVKAKRAGTTKIKVFLKSGKKAVCKVKVKAKKIKKKKRIRNSGNSGRRVAAVHGIFWTPSGSVYHTRRSCPTLNRSRTVLSGTLAQCPKKRKCKVC